MQLKTAVFTLIARGVHSSKMTETYRISAVFTLIARGVHSIMTTEFMLDSLYLPSLRGEFTAEA